MSEPQRAADPPEGSPADIDERERSSRVEQLLLAGLDHYFAGQYEQAIDVWTRVAFLERRHGKARAYIERARGALAERQRESEELVDRGRAAFDAGDVPTARRLLTEAVAQGGGGDTAALLLERLNRVDGRRRRRPAPRRPARPARPAGRRRRRRAGFDRVASAIVVAAVLVAGRMITATLAEWPDRADQPGGPTSSRCRCRGPATWRGAGARAARAGQVRQAIARAAGRSTPPTRRGRRPTRCARRGSARCWRAWNRQPRTRTGGGHEVPEVPVHRLRDRRPLPQLRLRLLAALRRGRCRPSRPRRLPTAPGPAASTTIRRPTEAALRRWTCRCGRRIRPSADAPAPAPALPLFRDDRRGRGRAAGPHGRAAAADRGAQDARRAAAAVPAAVSQDAAARMPSSSSAPSRTLEPEPDPVIEIRHSWGLGGAGGTDVDRRRRRRCPTLHDTDASPLGPRLAAALIDFGLLFGIDAVVIHFTLRLTSLTLADWRLIPLTPLLIFLVGLKLAYLSAFTLAGGQTIGKMATGHLRRRRRRRRAGRVAGRAARRRGGGVARRRRRALPAGAGRPRAPGSARPRGAHACRGAAPN